MTISKDTSAPLIVVVGATGIQGGSVIRALADSDKPYRIRGLTRDVSKPAPQELTNQGVEMTAVNLVVENKDAVFKAFHGADIAFIVTNFWEHMQKEKEVTEGTMLVDANKAAGVKQLIWSGLEDMTKASKGKYVHIDHFDGKAAVTTYAKQSGIPAVVDVQAGIYMTNYTGPLSPIKKAGDGTYTLSLPATPSSTTPLIDTAHDYGLFVRKAIESPSSQPFSAVYAHSEKLTHTEIAKQFSEVTGKNVKYVQLTEEEYKQGVAAIGYPPHIAQEIFEGYRAHDEFGYFADNDIKLSKEGLARSTRTWKEFVKVTDWSELLK